MGVEEGPAHCFHARGPGETARAPDGSAPATSPGLLQRELLSVCRLLQVLQASHLAAQRRWVR